jgi:hypothetical protein
MAAAIRPTLRHCSRRTKLGVLHALVAKVEQTQAETGQDDGATTLVRHPRKQLESSAQVEPTEKSTLISVRSQASLPIRCVVPHRTHAKKTLGSYRTALVKPSVLLRLRATDDSDGQSDALPLATLEEWLRRHYSTGSGPGGKSGESGRSGERTCSANLFSVCDPPGSTCISVNSTSECLKLGQITPFDPPSVSQAVLEAPATLVRIS